MIPRRLTLASLFPAPNPLSHRLLGLWPGPSASALAASKRHHDELLRILADVISRPHNGFDFVCADLEGWVRPKRILGGHTNEEHVPDAQAWLGSQEFIFEVETAHTVALEHTRRQCAVFSAYAYPQRGEFVLVVPNGLQQRAERQLRAWGIRGLVW